MQWYAVTAANRAGLHNEIGNQSFQRTLYILTPTYTTRNDERLEERWAESVLTARHNCN